MHLAPVDVSACAARAIQSVDLPQGIRVEVQGLSSLPAVAAGNRSLSLVFENLLNNAAEAMKGQGVISIQTSERNGAVVGAVQVSEEDEIMMITDGGTLVRNRVADVSRMGRNTQGVIMIRLSKQEMLIGIERIENLEAEEEGDMDDVEDEAE